MPSGGTNVQNVQFVDIREESWKHGAYLYENLIGPQVHVIICEREIMKSILLCDQKSVVWGRFVKFGTVIAYTLKF